MIVNFTELSTATISKPSKLDNKILLAEQIKKLEFFFRGASRLRNMIIA